MPAMIDLSKPARRRSTEEEDFSRFHYDTEIIHLQSYDNFYSLMDRLNQLDASGECSPRILLIWPTRGRIMEEPAEYGRLRGWAVRHNYQLAVIIPGSDVCLKMAREQGLPAYRSVKDAGEDEWDSGRQLPEPEDSDKRVRRLALLKKDVERTQRPQTPFGPRLLFFILALLSVAGVLYAVIPQAKVEITPYLTRESVTMSIWTDDRLDAPTMGGGIPTVEKKLELTLQAVVPATGSVRIASGIAVGEVTIRNNCDRTYPSSSGIILSTAEDIDSGIRFITLDEATLAAGEEKTVRIEAVDGGANANLAPGSIQYAEYPKSLCWEIFQTRETAGGSNGIYPAPTEADRSIAQQDIYAQIPAAAQEALQNDPDGQDLLPLGDAVITAVKQEQFLPETGFVSETLTLRQKVEVTVKTVRRSDMEAIIRGQSARLNAQVAGLTGYEILSGPKEENGLSVWTVQAEYLVYQPETNEEALQILLRGKTLPQARSILNTLEHVKESKITMLPSAMNRMPLAAQNIRVTIHPAVEVEEP